MKKILATLSGFAAVAVLAVVPLASAATTPFSQGFETDTSGWNNNGGTVNRVASGTNGVASFEGNYHAEFTAAGPFTRWGVYENEFPENGYVTRIAIHLDMAEADGSDKRLNYSSAINNPAGNHRRDFIFHAGTVPSTGATNEWAVSVSNNSPGWPLNPARNPIVIDTTGWYIFEHKFQDNGSGVLSVEMNLLDSNENQLGTWTLSDPTDIIGTTVGGNRYGWLVTSAFPNLPIDATSKNGIPVILIPQTKDDCKKGGFANFTDADGNPFKNQGLCVAYVASAGRVVANFNQIQF